MENSPGVTSLLTKALYVPYSSLALMGLLGVLGIASGFISYGQDAAPTGQAQALDTALPDMKGKGFKSNKYDNSYLLPLESADDSLRLAEIGKDAAALPDEEPSPPTPAAQPGNEGLSIEAIASSQKQWGSREEVRAQYNRKLDAQAHTNRQTIERLTAPAPLTPEERAERREREEALERAARMENLATHQLEMLQNSRPEGPGTDPSRAGLAGNGAPPPPSASPSSPKPETVTLANLDEYVALSNANRPVNAFYGLKGERKSPEMVAAKPVPNAIEAVIHGDADNVTLVTGSTLRLRLLQDIQVGKYLLPRNSILSGECAISGERVQVFVTTLRIGSSIIAVKMRAYDLDGHPGIYVPNLAVKNQVSQTGSQAVTGGGMQMPYMVPTGANIGEMVVGQTASQGVNMAINGIKSLTSKKMSVVKVTIRPNHRVYLKQDQQ